MSCTNEPPCRHSTFLHDVGDDGTEVPRCCMLGCPCGDPSAAGAEHVEGVEGVEGAGAAPLVPAPRPPVEQPAPAELGRT